jgi:hypothetical protein
VKKKEISCEGCDFAGARECYAGYGDVLSCYPENREDVQNVVFKLVDLPVMEVP